MKAATIPGFVQLSSAKISIHAAREGGDGTPSDDNLSITGISIHAAREGGDFKERQVRYEGIISIHAAREGGDLKVPLFCFSSKFQSTPPVKAATLATEHRPRYL